MATQEELQKKVTGLEAELEKAKVFYQFAEASGQGLAMATLEGEVTYVNATVCRLAGVDKPEDFYGTSLACYYPEELRSRLQNEVLPAVMQKGQWVGELAIRSSTGKVTPTIENIFLVRDEQGQPRYLADVMTDIAERKQAEAKSEEQYRHLVEKHPYGIHENDASGIITFANPAYCQIFGFNSPEEVIGKPIWLTLKTEEEQEQLRQYLAYLVNEQPPPVSYETKSFTKDGQPIDIKVDWDYRRDEQGQVIGFISVTTDITERKQAEESLQVSEERLRSVIDNMAVMFDVLNENGMIVVWNKECERVTGYSAEEIVNNPHAVELLYPDKAYREKMFDEWAKRPEDFANWEWDITCKDGQVKTIAWSKVSNQAPIEGWPSWYTGVDVTERKQAEAEREQMQQEVIEAQKRAIQELSTPVIPIMERIIVMPLVGSIDSLRARDITRSLLAGISQQRAKVVILDVTGVPIVDSGVANHLNKTIQAARLKGARTIITGISDAVAETIVDLGIDWGDIETLSDLRTGLVTALDRLGVKLSK
jgi:PAS domain S-box-containing protein